MEYKFCENCGAKMPVDSKFCTECGTPFPKKEEKKEQPAPVEQPAEQPVEVPVEAPVEAPVEVPAEQPAEPVAPVVPPVIPQAAAEPQPVPPQQPARPQPAQPQPIPQQSQPNPQQSQPIQQPRPQPYQPQPVTGTPVYAPTYGTPQITKESVKGTKYEPVSALGWFGIFLLAGIPLVGPLLIIIWACGGCRKQNKRTYARGILISWLVTILITGLLGLALRGKINGALENYAAENGIQYSEGTVVKDVLNSILNQYGYEIAD